MTDVKVYFPENRSKEIHMIGSYVGVCWNLKILNTRQEFNGRPQTLSLFERSGQPYLDFVWLRVDGSGTWWEDDDSPVSGGFGVEHAGSIITELLWAIEYIKGIT